MRRGPSLLVAACAGVLVTVGAVASTSPTTATATSAPVGPAAALLGVRDGPEARARLRAAGARPVAAELGIWRIASGRSVSVAAALRRSGLLRWVERDRRQPRATLGAGDPRATPDTGWHLYRVGVDRITLARRRRARSRFSTRASTLTHLELRSRPDTTYLNAHSPVTWGTPNVPRHRRRPRRGGTGGRDRRRRRLPAGVAPLACAAADVRRSALERRRARARRGVVVRSHRDQHQPLGVRVLASRV